MYEVLKEYDVGDGVFVSVNLVKYEILRIWVVGKEFELVDVGLWYFRIVVRIIRYFKFFLLMERYKRVVIVIRVKK